MEEFKSDLDKEIAEHGRRYGYLVHFAKAALDTPGVCVKHMPSAPPYVHSKGPLGLAYDEACVRCNLEKAIEHANRDFWKNEGLKR
jgi:hypothetical protein